MYTTGKVHKQRDLLFWKNTEQKKRLIRTLHTQCETIKMIQENL